MRRSVALLLACFSFAGFSPAALSPAQENVRVLSGSGVETKFLTPNGTDTWKIEVDAGETLRVHVSTREFDPVLELVAPDDTVLLEYDDEGSECRFAQRIEEAGEYRILVRGFEHRGGGNYQLTVQELHATPIEVGVETIVLLDREGRAHRRFEAQPDEIVVPVLHGTVREQALLDPQGAPIDEWLRTYRVTRAGEQILSLHGKRGAKLRVTVTVARREALEDGRLRAGELQPGEMHVYELERASLDFRLVELTRREGVATRLIRASEPDAKVLKRRGFDLRPLPVLSKGMHQRYASVFGRDDR